MSERTAGRAAGVTRITRPVVRRPSEALPTVDVTGWTADQLRAALTDRGLPTTGTTPELADRLEQAITDAYAALTFEIGA